MTILRRTACLAFMSVVLAASASAQTPGTAGPAAPPRDTLTWRIDKSHSELTFSIRHLISRVRGQFNTWTGSVTGDLNDWSNAHVSVTVDAASVDTNNESRDNDLRSEGHFDVAKFPNITFTSTSIERIGTDRFRMTGDLFIHGITRPVVIEGSMTGMTNDRQTGSNRAGRMRVGFEGSTTINRKEFDMHWNRAIEAGGLLLGEEVRIDIAVALVRG